MKKSFDVTILNQKLTLKSEADERYVQRVADCVNKKIHDILSNTQSVSTLRVAILAALNVADDYHRLLDKRKKTETELEKRIQELILSIDQCLPEDKKIDNSKSV